MNNISYKKIVDRNLKNPKYLKNYINAFLSGGIIGATCELLYLIMKSILIVKGSTIKSWITIFVIGISSFLTSIGIMDKLITRFRSGIIIPTTGFAHSVASSAIDAKHEGYITGLGSNFFSLAGSVILYSVVGSFFLILIKVMFT